MNAVAHAATDPSAKSPTVAVSWFCVRTTAAGPWGAFEVAVAVAALREPSASCETAGLPEVWLARRARRRGRDVREPGNLVGQRRFDDDSATRLGLSGMLT